MIYLCNFDSKTSILSGDIVEKSRFSILLASGILKMGSRSPKPNHFLSISQSYIPMQTSFKSIHFSPFFTSHDFENGSRSPKSNQFTFISKCYIFASLIQRHLFIQEIWPRKAIFQYSLTFWDLENRFKVIVI